MKKLIDWLILAAVYDTLHVRDVCEWKEWRWYGTDVDCNEKNVESRWLEYNVHINMKKR